SLVLPVKLLAISYLSAYTILFSFIFFTTFASGILLANSSFIFLSAFFVIISSIVPFILFIITFNSASAPTTDQLVLFFFILSLHTQYIWLSSDPSDGNSSLYFSISSSLYPNLYWYLNNPSSLFLKYSSNSFTFSSSSVFLSASNSTL